MLNKAKPFQKIQKHTLQSAYMHTKSGRNQPGRYSGRPLYEFINRYSLSFRFKIKVSSQKKKKKSVKKTKTEQNDRNKPLHSNSTKHSFQHITIKTQ